MKRLQFAILLSIPLCWFFFKLLQAYTHPSACSVPNFVYAENLEQLNRWCFDAYSKTRYDDSANFLYVFSLWLLIHFLKYTSIKAAFVVSTMSSLVSVYLIQRIIDSRFFGVNLLLVGLFFMSTQIWAGVLGDEVLFQGMLLLLAVRSYWKQRYFWLMIWSALNIMGRPDTLFLVLPLIIASYTDIRELKERYVHKFIIARIRKTVLLFIVPLLLFFTYRYLYFGKIMPYNWLHHSLETDKQFGVFNFEAFNYLKHYLRFYTLPLFIGVIFYFLKERSDLALRYYALAIGLIVIPMIYVCTYSQDENLAYKNYYSIYLGLILLALLFIRDYRSITQGVATAIFVLFFGFKSSFEFLQKTLQSYNDNEFYIANDLSQINKGKVIVDYNTFISWLTEWRTIYTNGRFTTREKMLTKDEIYNAKADLIITENITDTAFYQKHYTLLRVPKNTRQFEQQRKPDNSLDQFFYKNSRKVQLPKNNNYHVLALKESKNYNEIIKILKSHGANTVQLKK